MRAAILRPIGSLLDIHSPRTPEKGAETVPMAGSTRPAFAAPLLALSPASRPQLRWRGALPPCLESAATKGDRRLRRVIE